MLVLILFVAVTAANLNESTDFFVFNVAGFHPYDPQHVCQIFERNKALYFQTQNIKTGELSFLAMLPMRQSLECPWQAELCFRGPDEFSYIIAKNSCNNLTKTIKGLVEEYHIDLKYRAIRYDIKQSELYILGYNSLWKCAFLEFKYQVLNHKVGCNQVDSTNHSNWEDFVVSGNHIIFMANKTIYNEEMQEIAHSQYGSIPFSIFPKENAPFPWHTIIYLSEFIIIILLVYLCRIQISRTASGRIHFQGPQPSV